MTKKWPSSTFLIVCVISVAVLYFFYTNGSRTNPPGFYLDESCSSYNALLIAKTGKGDDGSYFPTYVRCYEESFTQYANPTHIYVLAFVFLFVTPSVFVARLVAVTSVFVACILLGVLAGRISRRRSVGVMMALTALATPWLFEVGHIVLEIFFYPFVLAFFLFCLHRAYRRLVWNWGDIALIGFSLGLITYTYTIGRVLGPALAFGLLLFVRNRASLIQVAWSWAAYALTLVPFVIVYLTNQTAVGKRIGEVSYVFSGMPKIEILKQFLSNYFTDISPTFLLSSGDPLLRHHIPGFGEIFIATLVLAVVGIIVALVRNWRDAWWHFIVYGLAISAIPAALTVQRYHALRLIGVCVFLLVLGVPALTWLVDLLLPRRDDVLVDGSLRSPRFAGRLPARIFAGLTLFIIFGSMVYQAVPFHAAFREMGPGRGHVFDSTYESLFTTALSMGSRPIYLEDGFWGPASFHAYWFGALKGIDRSETVRLADGEEPRMGSLVLSSNEKCSNCQIVKQEGLFMLYRVLGPNGLPLPVEPPPGSNRKFQPASLKRPRGIAVDADGSFYVTDTDNSRVRKFSRTGEPLMVIGAKGTGRGELSDPTGIAVDKSGGVFVADAANKALTRFNADGSFAEDWSGLGSPFDVAIDDAGHAFVADRERQQIVRVDLASGETKSFGEPGDGDGQFTKITGLSISGSNIFATDSQLDTVQHFDLDGNFIAQWPVEKWDAYIWHRPDAAADAETQTVYLSSGWTNEILVFDFDGTFKPSLPNPDPKGYDNPSSLAIYSNGDEKLLYVLNTSGDPVETGPPSIQIIDLKQ